MSTTGPARPGMQQRKASSMRPPLARPGANRAQTATPILNNRVSPADSMLSSKQRTPKRKLQAERTESESIQETNINVVVRCRGRNDREVRENSGVVVSTDGIRSKSVELSMGANALSNKSYQFDNVFSPAADQSMIFDEVVAPILNEVLDGFNCTIFAYGQTGTGKTYTMSGDITDTYPIPEAAGIIPRVLHTLFHKVNQDETNALEFVVKCSFIELYNEELRDLLAPDDNAKLKIYDEANKSGRTTTLVQGMEESYISNASDGIRLLKQGSHKRQVAATKCNDLSSRSHTIFTINIFQKRATKNGEDYVSTAKLNLVDLAGSENIQRSGAENKRATEAGLINKSLLTLGRVINALVDRSSHIPYRESKLTRLLQDSLGGRTKTCIITTLSPAKSNLEETISTLDYAFRAKNIRNKPQLNQLVSKKTLFREFAAEIEKLKSELIATRHRNGVYLTTENYEEITTESESRRILSEEQRDRIETIEGHLRNKIQELFALTNVFQAMKRDTEQAKTALEGTRELLLKADMVVELTKRRLAEEEGLREAYQLTEGKLASVGQSLLGTLDITTDHAERLHSKLQRRSDLHSANRSKWAALQTRTSESILTVEDRIEALRSQQSAAISSMSDRMQTFIADATREEQAFRGLIREEALAFQTSKGLFDAHTAEARYDMDQALDEIHLLRVNIKQQVGAGLDGLAGAAKRISAGIACEMDAFHQQLQDSYVSLGREFKTMFEDLVKQIQGQQIEAQRLQEQISTANASFLEAGDAARAQLQQTMIDERSTAATERAELLLKITSLVNESATTQERRVANHIEFANKRLKTSESEYRSSQQGYGHGMGIWHANAHALTETSIRSREAIKHRLKDDWTAANKHTTKINETAKEVHGETERLVGEQVAQIDNHVCSLDTILDIAKARSEKHHLASTSSFNCLADNVQQSYDSMGKQLDESFGRVRDLDDSMVESTAAVRNTLSTLDGENGVRQSLQRIREELDHSEFVEYEVTGQTPARVQYSYPKTLPRTYIPEAIDDNTREKSLESDVLLSPSARSPGKQSPPKRESSPRTSTSDPSKTSSSPSKPHIYTDAPPEVGEARRSALLSRPHSATQTLRELDVNLPSGGLGSGAEGDVLGTGQQTKQGKMFGPPLRRQYTDPLAASQGDCKYPMIKGNRTTTAALSRGRENIGVDSSTLKLSASAGAGSGTGRRLRNREVQ